MTITLPVLAREEVERVDLWLVELRLRRRHRAGATDLRRRPTVLVSVTACDGVVGWGECPALALPTYTAEWARGAHLALAEVVVPGWLAGRPEVVGHPMARGALADARSDAALRRGDTGLAAVLGVEGVAVASRAIVSADDDADLEEVVAGHLAAGRRHIGCKVRPGRLLEPLRRLRATWPEVSLAIDGNGQLGDVDDQTWRALDALGLDEVEQPCAAGDWLGSARVASRLACPVALDESVTDVDDVATMAQLAAGSVINLKPARLGGVARALEVARAAADRGLGLFVGGMLESGVGRAGALCLAALPVCDRPTHLGPSHQYWQRDLTDEVALGPDGTLRVAGGHGFGGSPDPALVADHAVDHVMLTPPT